MNKLGKIELVSADSRFGILVGEDVVRMIARCCSDAYPLETGGILLGRYSDNHDMAVVLKASFPPTDSGSGKNWFLRGVTGLQQLIDKLWKSNNFYLGEWHYHPDGAPVVSQDDIAAISKIATDPQYKCPEPILLIIGGGRKREWEARGYVCDGASLLIDLGSRKLGS